MQAAQVAEELSRHERALRRLPLPYSLALRLRDAGISADVICQYLNVELAALDSLYRMAEAKLLAAQNVTDDR
jgi:DNA-directed RNA polymerase specialized sigma24 family protein